MPTYVVETDVATGEKGECVSREWRVRAAVGELRRQGFAVLVDRAIRAPDEGRCLFVLIAASARVVARVAELAQLEAFRVVDAGTVASGDGRSARGRASA